MERKTVFISTAIPYVNAKPHIGFALELVEADVLARFKRVNNNDVFLLTGTDENSLKNVQTAEELNIPTAEFVEKNAKFFQKLAVDLNISNDGFIRTSIEEKHKKGAEKLWSSCRPEDIYKKQYKGFYCVGCEEFKTAKDLKNGKCSEHPNREVEVVEEENYFFKLSNYQNKLKEIIETGKMEIIPETRKNEMLSFINSGLEDFSISRSNERAKRWGVKVPQDEEQTIYVWFDALSNYITALDYALAGEKFKKYWEGGSEIIHVIGKGINRFHTIYWPAMLMSAGVRIPTKVFVHGYITSAGQKMSKSLGNVVDPFELIEKYGADAVRYYLLREIPAYDDGDFSPDKFKSKYNGDLANGLGNFASRVLKLASSEKISGLEVTEETQKEVDKTEEIVNKKIEEFKFNEALAAIFSLVSFGDRFVNEKKPWEKKDDYKEAIKNSLFILKRVADFIFPFLPDTSEKINSHISNNAAFENPLFPRV